MHLRSISKLYIQDACINKRDNELGLGSIQLPACAEAQDSSSATCQSVFKDGEQHYLYIMDVASEFA